MVYTMKIKVDGGCRGNGQPGAIGAAAAVFLNRLGHPIETWHRKLNGYPYVTNQRAEISAMILALSQALKKYEGLDTEPYLDLTIMSDSRYAVGCMEQWIYKWSCNGWRNATGNEVANRDLIEEAIRLDDRVKEVGEVRYVWIPRGENGNADEACDKLMDEMVRETNTVKTVTPSISLFPMFTNYWDGSDEEYAW